MAKFVDAEGREWRFRITVGDVERLHAETGVNVPSLLADEFKELDALLSDPVRLARTVWPLIEGQASGYRVTREQFFQAIHGDSIDALTLAFEDALADFFPSAKRRLMRAVMAAGRAEMAAALAKLEDFSGTAGNSPARPESPTPAR